MTVTPRSAACERARFWASLLPDGELSLFERRLLDAHCVRCASCRELHDDVKAVTTVVRTTPLEEMSRPVRVVRQRLPAWRPAAGVVASGGAAVLAFVLAVWIGPQVRSAHVTTRYVSAPTIVIAPSRTSADSQAIWTFKRQRGTDDGPGVARHAGLIL
jgi:hypothetical protein